MHPFSSDVVAAVERDALRREAAAARTPRLHLAGNRLTTPRVAVTTTTARRRQQLVGASR